MLEAIAPELLFILLHEQLSLYNAPAAARHRAARAGARAVSSAGARLSVTPSYGHALR